jgi:hypothetical protein
MSTSTSGDGENRDNHDGPARRAGLPDALIDLIEETGRGDGGPDEHERWRKAARAVMNDASSWAKEEVEDWTSGHLLPREIRQRQTEDYAEEPGRHAAAEIGVEHGVMERGFQMEETPRGRAQRQLHRHLTRLWVRTFLSQLHVSLVRAATRDSGRGGRGFPIRIE